MKFPESWYPPPVIQHTLSLAAVAFVDVVCEYYRRFLPEKKNKAKLERIGKIETWANEVSIQLRRGQPLSSPAKRHLLAAVDVVNKRANLDIMPVEKRYARLAAMVYAALLHVLDVRNTCPVYGQGAHRKGWQYLGLHLDRLAAEERQAHPGADEIGTGLYEEMAYALDGEDFVAEQFAGEA